MADVYVYRCKECGRPTSIVVRPIFLLCCHKEVKDFEVMTEKKADKKYKEWEKNKAPVKKPERKKAKK